MQHVIIGASAAGLAAAETLRKWAPRDRITLISDEPRAFHIWPAAAAQGAIAGAISRDPVRGATNIDPARCINCAMCAMACPFGVLTYAGAFVAPEKKSVALKCDQCPDREAMGRIPAWWRPARWGRSPMARWGRPRKKRAGPWPGRCSRRFR